MFITMFTRREFTNDIRSHTDLPSVQPVVHKETVVPEVVHTTIPIHEKHTAPSEHHGMSVLPTKSLSEFQQQGGSVTGAVEPRHENYEGDPRPYNAALQQEREPADLDPKAHDGMHDLESTGHSRPGTSNTTDSVTGTSQPQVGALGDVSSLPSGTSGGIGSNERSAAVGGESRNQTDALAGTDARRGPATDNADSGLGSERDARAVDGSSGPQTGALGGLESTPSTTTGGVGSTERNPAVGGSSDLQTGALAGATAAGAGVAAGSTFGGEGAFHTDPVGDHSSVTAPSSSSVEHFRDDPISAEQNTSPGVQGAGLTKSTTDAADSAREMRGSGIDSR